MPETVDTGIRKTVALYRDAFQASAEYVSPHWEMAVRLYKLWRGHKPEQLDSTFSKLMINAAHSLVQERIPKLQNNILGNEEFISLEPTEPKFEVGRESAEAWLRDMFRNESKLNFAASSIPTLQSACIFGTGYRMPCIRRREGPKGSTKVIVRSPDVDYFQILPAPVGGLLNTLDDDLDSACPYFFHVDWWNDDQIEALSKFKGFNKGEFERMKKRAIDPVSTIDTAYGELYTRIGAVSFGTPRDWRMRMNDVVGKSGRRRIVSWHSRTSWRIIVQDEFLVYEGEPAIGKGILPLVKYTLTPDLKHWYGVGVLEMVEDLIIAQLMNFNFRMDRLASTMFPTKWIRTDVMMGRPEAEFYDRPYAVHEFPTTVQRIGDAIHIDRGTDIPQQAFVEDDRMKAMVQEISGISNFSKGFNEKGFDGGATGIVSLIRQAEGRVEAESINLECDGIAQEARLILILADKFIYDFEEVRSPNSRNGSGWTVVDPQDLQDGYIIHVLGTRYQAQRDQAFQRLMALYPNWKQNPMFDQYELERQVGMMADVLPNMSKILRPPAEASPGAGMVMPGQGGAPALGGQASSQDIMMRGRSVAGRTGVRPGSMQQAPAQPGTTEAM